MQSSLTTGETTHDGSKRFHARVGNDEVGEPEPLASPQQILDDLLGSANVDRRHVQNVLDSNATPPSLARALFGSLSPPLTEPRRYHDAQFQFIKASSR